ncbi:hypothetical protein [Tropicimonas aquimaris]|uniref:Uncharacterized protein n=1 Tax=Tropicimonas aquimaris TaxID=914152 RepID=A0ABW3IY26_9RHOB
MKQGPFLDRVAEVFGVERKTVQVIARALREAGYLTTGARGVNAPHMTARDAANISIALLTGEPPSKVVPAFEFYSSQLPCEEVEVTELSVLSLCRVDDQTTFGTLVERLFDLWKVEDAKLDPYCWNSGIPMEPTILVRLSEDHKTTSVHAEGEVVVFHDRESAAEYDRLWEERMELGRDSPADQRRQIELLDQQMELLMHGMVSGKGLRVTREFTTVEISKIAIAIFDGERGEAD